MLTYPDPIYNYSDITSSWKSYSPEDFDESKILTYNSEYEFDDVEAKELIIVRLLYLFKNIDKIVTIWIINIQT